MESDEGPGKKQQKAGSCFSTKKGATKTSLEKNCSNKSKRVVGYRNGTSAEAVSQEKNYFFELEIFNVQGISGMMLVYYIISNTCFFRKHHQNRSGIVCVLSATTVQS